jgi:hypothetical protein
MRFTLYYDGSLPSAANEARLPEKHRVRKAIHPQLLQLFRTSPLLPKPDHRDWANWAVWDWPVIRQTTGTAWGEDEAVFRCGELHFVPLVRRSLDLICELDVLFLRPGAPGAIITGGDIDNRILTLSDGLRLPRGEREIAYANQQTDFPRTDPIFCLLEDDSLITRWNVRTDQLLAPASGGAASDVRLVIDVVIKAARLTWSNLDLSGG